MINAKAYINGKSIESNDKVQIVSPIDLKVFGTVPSLKPKDINNAFESARKAFPVWRNVSPTKRMEMLRIFADKLLKQKNELANTMFHEIGKNIQECIVEIERTFDYINQTIEEYKKMEDNIVVINKKTSIQKRVPLGVVLAISPFNYPVNLSLTKIAPALLTGNTIVFKAATNGSLTGAHIAKIFASLNSLPNGVFNYVTGRGSDIGDEITSHTEIDMVSFTGGVFVGERLASRLAMKPKVLELGGNDAAYVRNDADLDLAVSETIGGAFGFAGQRCTAIKRVILHKQIAEVFLNKITSATSKLELNPVISMHSAKYIRELYDDSLSRGDKIIVEPFFNKNNISPGIVITSKDSRVWREETFGPILPIVIVGNDNDAINLINDSEFGLQNSIFTTNYDWATNIASEIESGTVNINAKPSRGPDLFPFSGIKKSGFGTQGIKYALESMTRILNIVQNKK